MARRSGLLLAPIPALTVGVLVMRRGDLPAAVWLLNVAAAMVGILIAGAALAWRRVGGVASPSSGALRWLLVAALALLGATLVAPGAEGVHRWLPLGPLSVQVSAVLLPPMLVALGGAPWIAAVVVAGTTLLVLSLQPDAAQGFSFCAGWIVVIAARHAEKARMPAVIASLVLGAMCLLRPDPLAPVAHVEGIVGMAAGQGRMLAGAALLSLAVLPMCLAACLVHPVRWVLAVYFAGTLIAAWLGNYPVPILGYGVAPILGYYAALAAHTLVYGRGGKSTDEPAFWGTG